MIPDNQIEQKWQESSLIGPLDIYFVVLHRFLSCGLSNQIDQFMTLAWNEIECFENFLLLPYSICWTSVSNFLSIKKSGPAHGRREV